MDLNKKIDLIESLGDCKEYFLLGKQTDTDEFVYSCTEIENASEFADILESIAQGIRDSVNEQLMNIDAVDDLLDEFNINKNNEENNN